MLSNITDMKNRWRPAYRGIGDEPWCTPGDGRNRRHLDRPRGRVRGTRRADPGGAIAIENGRIVGGDNNLAYIGECRVDGTELTGSLHVIRHGDPEYATFFGSKDIEYTVQFVGERLSRDYYEGRLKVRPGVEGRMFMRRLLDLPARQVS